MISVGYSRFSVFFRVIPWSMPIPSRAVISVWFRGQCILRFRFQLRSSAFICGSMVLPAQPHHLAAQRPALRDIDQVENDLVFAHMARKRLEGFRIVQAYN